MTQLRTIIAAALLFAGLSSQALAASTCGTTDVAVNVPECIVLHYYSSITMNFDTPTSEALDEGSNELKTSWSGSTSGCELNANTLMNASIEAGKTSVTLRNVCAVRGFSASGNAKVEVTVPSATMQKGSSEITMSNVKVSDGTSCGSSITTKLNGMSKNHATMVDIDMDLDFSKTTCSGSHTGGQYTVTATTI